MKEQTCSACGAKLKKGAAFCNNCGQKVPEPAEAVGKDLSSGKPKKNGGLVALIAVLAVALVAVIACLLLELGVFAPKTKDCKVTFDADNGSALVVQTFPAGSKAVKPADPEKADAVFAYWSLNGQPYDFSETLTQDITLKAVYNAYITVAFYNEDQLFFSYTALAGSPVPPFGAMPEKVGYSFVEWQLNGERFNFDEAVWSDLEIKAFFAREFTVTIITQNGTDIVRYVREGEVCPKPSDPDYGDPNMVFTGWYGEDGLPFDFNTPITSDRMIVAHYDFLSAEVPFVSAGFDRAEYTVEVGQKITPVITVTPANTTENLMFLSQNAGIANFDDDGGVRGIREGDVYIYIVPGFDPSGMYAARALVHVVPSSGGTSSGSGSGSGGGSGVALQSASFDAYEYTVRVGQAIYPGITLNPSNATDFMFLSKDSSIANFDDDGMVRGLKPGDVFIFIVPGNDTDAMYAARALIHVIE